MNLDRLHVPGRFNTEATSLQHMNPNHPKIIMSENQNQNKQKTQNTPTSLGGTAVFLLRASAQMSVTDNHVM